MLLLLEVTDDVELGGDECIVDRRSHVLPTLLNLGLPLQQTLHYLLKLTVACQQVLLLDGYTNLHHIFDVFNPYELSLNHTSPRLILANGRQAGHFNARDVHIQQSSVIEVD